MKSRASRKAKCTYPRRKRINGDYLRSTRVVHIVRSHYKKKSRCRRMGFQMPRRIFQPVQMLSHHQRHTMDGSHSSRTVTLVSTRDTICRMIRHGDLYGWRLFDPCPPPPEHQSANFPFSWFSSSRNGLEWAGSQGQSTTGIIMDGEYVGNRSRSLQQLRLK